MALTTGFFSSSRLILVGVHRALTGGCEGSPLIPRAELSLWWAGRGAYLILKDEWRLTRRSHPASLPRTPTPVSLPPISARAYTPIYRYAKKPPAPPPPSGVGKPGAFMNYPLQHYQLRRGQLRRYPLMLRQLLCLGCFVAGEHRCGCGQFGAGHERGAEGCELACVAFGYAEQGQQLGGRVGHDGLQ